MGEIDDKSFGWGFGDDAWFLSWLWITVEEKAKPVIEKEEEPVFIVEKKKWKPVYDKDDIIPTMKEAKVIRRAPAPVVKKKDASSKDVDDLIKKKSQTEESAYKEIWARKPSTWRTASRPSARSWWRSAGRWRRPAGRPLQGNKAITIGATARRSAWSNDVVVEKKEKTYKVSDSLKKKSTIQIGEFITVKEFSEKMWVPFPEVMKVLLANKIVTAAHANIDYDTAVLVATEFDVTIERETLAMSVEDVFEWNLQAILNQDKDSENLYARPPVVTIMGHVDHGKTKLLDYLRQTDVVGGEAGGITQSIGASQITHNDQKITFIDTPGHELFTAIRARGSKITNIVIIVVAANDGIKPQTIEAIHHAKDAWAPIIVAITKIDLWIHKLEEIKGKLAENGLQPEDRGGDVMIVPCSAMTWQWIDDLLDAVLLQYEMLELKFDPARNAVWVVVEAHKDAKKWVTTTMLIMTGTLRVWDIITVHNTYGRVRRMTDRTGKKVKTATGGDPVMILGIQDLPEPGRVAEVVNTDKEANNKISAIKEHEQSISKEAILQDIMQRIGKWDSVQLKLIIKSNSFGSLEAIKHAAKNVPMPENVVLKIIHDDVGDISSSDLIFAQAAQAIVIWFNVSISGSLKKKATQMQVEVKEYEIIYKFLEYLEDIGKWMIKVELKEVITGKLEVLGHFFRKWKVSVFGGKVTEWKIINKSRFRVYRASEQEFDEDEQLIPYTTGVITSLQKEQDSVKEVKEGYECGMKTKTAKKIEVGDIIEYYIME